MGAIPSVPRTRPERTQEKPARFLSAVEESRVLSILHPRERELCVILLYTGMRKSELWGLTWEDIDWETGLIQVHQTKSGKRRFLPITSRVRAILEGLQEAGKATPAGGMNINTFDDHFRNACKTARVLGVSVHTLRHTYASRLAQNGVSLLLIQKLLGHSSASTTLVYAHLVEKSFEDAVLRTFDNPEE
jgi:integrase